MSTGYTTLSNTYQVRGGGNGHTVGMLPHDRETSCSNRGGEEVRRQCREVVCFFGDQIRYSVLATGGLFVTTVYSSCDFQAGELRELSPQVHRWRAERWDTLPFAGGLSESCALIGELCLPVRWVPTRPPHSSLGWLWCKLVWRS